MSFDRDRPLKIMPLVYRGLLAFLVVLVLLLIAGTIYGIFIHGASIEREQAEILRETGEGQTFTGIGQLRIPSADPQPGMTILFVSFTYYPDDKAFSEELTLRIRDFREIIIDYIGSFSTTELQNIDEESIKTELLHRFNALLRLGQIGTLYFSDFMIIN